MCASAGKHVPWSTWRGPRTALVSISASLLWDRISVLAHGIFQTARPRNVQDSFFYLLSPCWITEAHTMHTAFFYGLWGFELQYSHLHGKHFYPLRQVSSLMPPAFPSPLCLPNAGIKERSTDPSGVPIEMLLWFSLWLILPLSLSLLSLLLYLMEEMGFHCFLLYWQNTANVLT